MSVFTREELIPRLTELLLEEAAAQAMDVHGRTKAGVLVPLFLDADGYPHAVFTKRRDDLRRHPGEISFPGGRQDPGEDLRTTALREAEEEIGLPRDAVEVVGALPPVGTFVTSYAIYPVVGVIEAGMAWTISANEVETVLELPLAAVRDGFAMRRLVRRGVPFRTPTYTVGDSMIWGATARIVGHLLQHLEPLLGPAPTPPEGWMPQFEQTATDRSRRDM